MKRLLSTLLFASALALPSFAAKVTFHADIVGAGSPMTGVANLELDPSTGAFHLVVNVKNANELLTNSHIHLGAVGVNGPVIVPLGGETVYRRVAGKNLHQVFTGTVQAANLEAMLSNGTYINFHTATFPASAARGQLIANDVELWAELSGANEVPPRDTPAMGTASVLYNSGTKKIAVHVEVMDYANLVTGSHIHQAPVGVAGPIVLGLGAEAAYTRVGNSLTGNFLDLTYPGPSLPLLTGGTYINLHSAQYPAGEIRGQIVGN